MAANFANLFGFGCCAGGGGSIDSGGHLPGCFCDPIASPIRMTSADPNCNFRMFQSCTLQYGPTPPEFGPLNLGANIILSTQTFPDPIAGGALFYYNLLCHSNQFSLTRVYPTSPYGSPYRDGILYTWLLGGANTCHPFRMVIGSAFPGSDPSCSVTLDQI